jgi:hypothetical protein
MNAKYYIVLLDKSIMQLPKYCSIRVKGKDCNLPSSYIVSIESPKDEYMIGVVCMDHKDELQERIKVMQLKGSAPLGTIKIQTIRIISTDCIKGTDEDYMEVSSKRDIILPNDV